MTNTHAKALDEILTIQSICGENCATHFSKAWVSGGFRSCPSHAASYAPGSRSRKVLEGRNSRSNSTSILAEATITTEFLGSLCRDVLLAPQLFGQPPLQLLGGTVVGLQVRNSSGRLHELKAQSRLSPIATASTATST